MLETHAPTARPPLHPPHRLTAPPAAKPAPDQPGAPQSDRFEAILARQDAPAVAGPAAPPAQGPAVTQSTPPTAPALAESVKAAGPDVTGTQVGEHCPACLPALATPATMPAGEPDPASVTRTPAEDRTDTEPTPDAIGKDPGDTKTADGGPQIPCDPAGSVVLPAPAVASRHAPAPDSSPDDKAAPIKARPPGAGVGPAAPGLPQPAADGPTAPSPPARPDAAVPPPEAHLATAARPAAPEPAQPQAQPAGAPGAPAPPPAIALATPNAAPPAAPATVPQAARPDLDTPQTPVPPARIPAIVAELARDGARRFEIRLAPEDLGRVDVRLDIDRDGAVRTHLIVERPEALAALRREANALQQAVSDAGLRHEPSGVQVSLRQGGDGQHQAAYRRSEAFPDASVADRGAEGSHAPGDTPRRRLALRSALDIVL